MLYITDPVPVSFAIGGMLPGDGYVVTVNSENYCSAGVSAPFDIAAKTTTVVTVQVPSWCVDAGKNDC